MWETHVRSLGQKDPLEKGMATHSSVLAWKIPWTEEPCGLWSMGSQGVRLDWETNTLTFKSNLNSEAVRRYLCFLRDVFLEWDGVDAWIWVLEQRWLTRDVHACAVAQLCATLCAAMNCSLPGSSVYGIFQARILEWVAVSSSRGIFPTQGWNPHLLCLLHYRSVLYPLNIEEAPSKGGLCFRDNTRGDCQWGGEGHTPPGVQGEVLWAQLAQVLSTEPRAVRQEGA